MSRRLESAERGGPADRRAWDGTEGGASMDGANMKRMRGSWKVAMETVFPCLCLMKK